MKTKILLAVVLIVAAAVVLWAQNGEHHAPELPDEVTEWERLAEQGDTTALHKLLVFLDDNAPVYVEVEEVIEVEAESGDSIVSYGDTIVAEDDIVCDTVVTSIDSETEAFYNSRLDYWLSKGLAMSDPVATYIKGMRLYYTDEVQALKYLSQSAESGNSRAALFCGSAYFNQGRGQDAIKYLTIAYELNEPSAGWHLAMCLVQRGNKTNIEQAIEYLRHSAELDYPEAVLEMRRIEPANPVWQHKVDRLDISFLDFPIIPDSI